MTVTIRPARAGDAPVLGSVHVRAWQKAYRGGLLPQAFLARLSIADREAMWRATLTGSDETERGQEPRRASMAGEQIARLVAVLVRGGPVGGPAIDRMDRGESEPIGFIVVGPDRGGSEGAGEVAALNVDPDHWGEGAGRALLEAGVAHLRAEGFTDAVLWVHPGNLRARRFYERAGWLPDGSQRREEVLGVEVPEVRYRRQL